MFIPPVGETESLSLSDPLVYISFFLLLLLGAGFVATCFLTRRSARQIVASLAGAQFRGQRMLNIDTSQRKAREELMSSRRDVDGEERPDIIDKTEEMTFGQKSGGTVDWITMYHWRKLAEEERKIKQNSEATLPIDCETLSQSESLRLEAASSDRYKKPIRGVPSIRQWRGYTQLEPVGENDTE